MQEAVKKPSKNLIGQKFGKLTVLSYSHHKGKYAYWRCKCECGTEKDIYQQNLLSGAIKTCGCGRKTCGEKFGKENLHMFQGVQIEKAMAKTTPKNNTSGFRGVYKDKKTGKWRARIILQGERTELGYFEHFADAVEARKKAEEKIDQIITAYKKENQNPTAVMK